MANNPKYPAALLGEAAARAIELVGATNALELAARKAAGTGPSDAATLEAACWHNAAVRLCDGLQEALGKRAGLCDDDGGKGNIGESLYAGTASRAECLRAARYCEAREGESELTITPAAMAAAINRSRMASDIKGTAKAREAKAAALHLVAIDLAATAAAENPAFDKGAFLTACGFSA